MSMGNPTDIGIPRYQETTTTGTTFSGFLNRGIEAISNFLRDTMRAGDTGWQIPTLLNSWVSGSVRYRRLNGVLYLRGALASGTTNAAFVLPEGYRPVSEMAFVVQDGAGTSVNPTLVRILSNGQVQVLSGTIPQLWSISFALN